ncbi:DNA-3-methyladenine glycosylase-like isoform X2 [Ischnura elegans]|uniref:DNA-3-methyladenine glycosylase-like isoform X2 n=1 Tax=Ischnura elegans TaxID=197161 RepID=UPI001ED8762B|nr:DNA-3-methyladenine glycosylase-like isoform X2 [Ischnura elegans]
MEKEIDDADGESQGTSLHSVEVSARKPRKRPVGQLKVFSTRNVEVSADISATVAGNQNKTSERDSKIIANTRFLDSFYDVPCDQLAKNLLGHVLVRQLSDGKLLKGRIVETECYPGGEDRASHSFQGKMTERNAPMYMKPGTTYVYFTYGMYHCFNISSQGPGAAVLLRAIEPLEGMDYMQQERNKKRKVACMYKAHQLANGPSKLCISMSIDKGSCNAQDMCSWDGLWIEPAERDYQCGDSTWLAAVEAHKVVATSRIGITSSGAEWASKPYRFYVIGNASVSKRDKIKEKEVMSIAEILEKEKRRCGSLTP